MKASRLTALIFLALSFVGWTTSGCSSQVVPDVAVLTVPPVSPTSVATKATPDATALTVVTATMPPTIAPPSPTPPESTVAPTLIPTPSATPVDPAAGLPCAAETPIKPEYARDVVGSELWPPADTSRTWPHLWLANPLAVEGMPRINGNFPYGSDGNGRYLLHNGLDLVEPPGTPVLAAADGTVIVAAEDTDRQYGWRCDWYGHLVVIELDQLIDGEPVYVLYGHVVDIEVSPGEHVRQGDQLAAVGIGGVATAPHLHLEVRVGANEFGATQNPVLWLNPEPGYGTIAGRLIDPEGFPWQGITITLIDLSGQSDFAYTWTYLDDPDHLINPDAALGENFAFGYVPSGDYDVYARVQDQDYRQRVTVDEQGVALVEIVTDPYLTPTPGALPTGTP